MKKIAVIGSGISGIASAYYLKKYGQDVTLFESNSYFGGHTNTIDIKVEEKVIPVDTGFLVHNDRTYPNLIDFFNELGIPTYKSSMSFSVNNLGENIVWAGTNLSTVFAQPKNLLKPRFYKFLLSILRFNRHSHQYLQESQEEKQLTLKNLLDRHKYSEDFRSWYLLPMGGCIWSTPVKKMLDFPAYTFMRFCMNHGLLQITNRPQWKTVIGGCRTYVEKALSHIDQKYLNTPVVSVESEKNKVIVNRKHTFDFCFMCSHPPGILQYLRSKSSELKNVLSKFRFQKNIAILHNDNSVLPKKKAWSSWNYSSQKNDDGQDRVSVSYLINLLQPLQVKTNIIVTLNPIVPICEDKIFRKIDYQHPLFDIKAINSQENIEQFQGKEHYYFAGAWMRYGFHEDGILSAKKAVQKFLKDTQQKAEGFQVL